MVPYFDQGKGNTARSNLPILFKMARVSLLELHAKLKYYFEQVSCSV